MAVNKVVYGTTVLVDLTEDTVTADTLAKGITAHDKAGTLIEGTLESGGSFAYGSITPSSSGGNLVVPHNLGVVPTWFMIYSTNTSYYSTQSAWYDSRVSNVINLRYYRGNRTTINISTANMNEQTFSVKPYSNTYSWGTQKIYWVCGT